MITTEKLLKIYLQVKKKKPKYPPTVSYTHLTLPTKA